MHFLPIVFSTGYGVGHIPQEYGIERLWPNPLGYMQAAARSSLLHVHGMPLTAPGGGASSTALSLTSCVPDTVPTILSLAFLLCIHYAETERQTPDAAPEADSGLVASGEQNRAGDRMGRAMGGVDCRKPVLLLNLLLLLIDLKYKNCAHITLIKIFKNAETQSIKFTCER